MHSSIKNVNKAVSGGVYPRYFRPPSIVKLAPFKAENFVKSDPLNFVKLAPPKTDRSFSYSLSYMFTDSWEAYFVDNLGLDLF